MDFAKEFNARTANIEEGTPMRVWVSYAADRSFTFDVRMPETQWFIRRAAGIEKASTGPPTGDFLLGVRPPAARTEKDEVGQITLKHVYEIARLKHTFDSTLKHVELAGLCATVIANAKTMGAHRSRPLSSY
jgi:large subunit ribosomal protein L11